MANERQFFRDINPGDVSIEGRKSNGVTADINGNTIIYAGIKQSELQKLNQEKYLGNVPIDGYTSTFIAALAPGQLPPYPAGNNNNETYFESKTTDPNKIIVANQQITPTPTPQPTITITPTPTSLPTTETTASKPAPDVEGGFVFLDETGFAIEPVQLTGIIEIENNNNEILTDNDIVEENKIEKKNNSKRTGTLKILIQNNTKEYGNLGDIVYYPTPLYNQGDPEWGSYTSVSKNKSYSQTKFGCCYNTVCMLLGNAIKDANKATPYAIWNSGKPNTKSVVVYYNDLASVVGKSITLIPNATMNKIDEILKTKPVGFEWQGGTEFTGKGWDKGYNNYRGIIKTSPSGIKAPTKGISYTCCKQHWMVITGKNKDGTYTVFDPAGGVIRKNQSRGQIEAGLSRIVYIN